MWRRVPGQTALGGSTPKQFLLLDGRSLIAHTAAFDRHTRVHAWFVVLPKKITLPGSNRSDGNGECIKHWATRRIGGEERQKLCKTDCTLFQGRRTGFGARR
jgi:2-C-methyl-D-erythritol 4-phosphate cytidylyltransferase